MKQKIITTLLILWTLIGYAQQDTIASKDRLSFAKTYFEAGGNFYPSFEGKQLLNNNIETFKNSASFSPNIVWGGFHFYGHTEFYVTIPLTHLPLKKHPTTNSSLLHSVATGARFYPWAYQENKLRPYVGLSWSQLDFKQEIQPDKDAPVLSKDFTIGTDAGIMYGTKYFSFRLAGNFFFNNKWAYPLSKTQKATIKTPPFALQLGILYSMDYTKKTTPENVEKWNSFPTVSKLNYAKEPTIGGFFVGVAPSISFSLKKSAYNQSRFPYLKDRLTSTNYFEFAAGYQFYNWGLFTAFSYRNPKFSTQGFGSKQEINKTSFALEVNKFLTDYTGFVPFVGLNLAYDSYKYKENIDGISRTLNYDYQLTPGLCFGWDIRPGKNQEALILRTNLRWYPFSAIEVDNLNFNMSQLEYNFIQVIIYPDKLMKKEKGFKF